MTAALQTQRYDEIEVAGAGLTVDLMGALYWAQESLLVVSDLHLEKGSSFAGRGAMLPPYDTAETLLRLQRLVAAYRPSRVVSLGDSFHDRKASTRLATQDRDALALLQRGRDWIWITGNHDPDPVEGVGGTFTAVLGIGPLLFRHEPSPDAVDGEIAGHLHPAARVVARGGSVRRPCFIHDGKRAVMPALGAYTGGLNVRDRAFGRLFAPRSFRLHVLGRSRVYEVGADNCAPD